MRKVILGAVAVGALAWAQGAPADHHTTAKSGESGQMDRRSAGQQPGTDSAVTGQDANRKERGGERRGVFEGKSNFDVDGRVSSASSGEVTIERQDLPPATLKVAPGTKVEVDGEAASAAQLKAGQEVKASFNLRGGTAEAVEVKASKMKDDDARKLQEQRQETRKDMQEERQKDAPRQPAR